MNDQLLASIEQELLAWPGVTKAGELFRMNYERANAVARSSPTPSFQPATD